jgi:hypothetical protein
MEELAKLSKSTLKRKPQRNSVPRGVNYWLFFKRHVLERADVRARFEAEPLSVDDFRQLVKVVANPLKWGPSFCRQRRGISAKTVKRNTNDMLAVLWHYYKALLHPTSPMYVAESATMGGLGLFARRAATVTAGACPFENHLWGVPFELDEAGFAELQADNYPSLYHTPDGRAHILCGPLALVNHQCASPLAFSLPRKVSASRGGISMEEFSDLSAVYARATVRYRATKDNEITIDYFTGENHGNISFAGAECRCATCAINRTDDVSS